MTSSDPRGIQILLTAKNNNDTEEEREGSEEEAMSCEKYLHFDAGEYTSSSFVII